MQFLAFLEAVASNLTASNISEFITLTENLIAVAESVFQHQAAPVVAPVAPVVAPSPSAAVASAPVAAA